MRDHLKPDRSDHNGQRPVGPDEIEVIVARYEVRRLWRQLLENLNNNHGNAHGREVVTTVISLTKACARYGFTRLRGIK